MTVSSNEAALALLLDGPLQSWGYTSRFQRRTTALHPTKSGVIGLLCAALGLAKGSPEEEDILPKLGQLRMTSIALPRKGSSTWTGWTGERAELPVRRLEDFHTVLGTRRASGKMNDDAVVTRRQYLLDARFGIILTGGLALLQQAAEAVQNPSWGVWLGRKSCIPASPLFVTLCESEDEAWKTLLRACQLDENSRRVAFTQIMDVTDFSDGTDSIPDLPLSFGDGVSSGPEKRQFSVRRIRMAVAESAEANRSNDANI